MKNTLLKMCLSYLALTSAAAYAQQYCTTKVNNLAVYSNGDTLVRLTARSDYLQVCSMSADWKGVTPQICATWVALIKSAVARNTDMIFYYTQTTACNLIPTYANAPAPAYVMQMN
jgi:hypothetical protein